MRAGLICALWLAGCIGPGLEPPGDSDRGASIVAPGSGSNFGNPGMTSAPTQSGGDTGQPGDTTPGAGTAGTGAGDAPGAAPPTGATPDTGGNADPVAQPPAVCAGPPVVLIAPDPLAVPDAGLDAPDAGIDPLPEPDGGAAGGADACTFVLPLASIGVVDPATVAWQLVTATGAQGLADVGDASGCVGAGGFYYDDPAAPQVLVLCPASCAAVSEGAGLSLVLGCTP